MCHNVPYLDLHGSSNSAKCLPFGWCEKADICHVVGKSRYHECVWVKFRLSHPIHLPRFPERTPLKAVPQRGSRSRRSVDAENRRPRGLSGPSVDVTPDSQTRGQQPDCCEARRARRISCLWRTSDSQVRDQRPGGSGGSSLLRYWRVDQSGGSVPLGSWKFQFRLPRSRTS